MPEPMLIKCPSCGSGLKVKDYSLIGRKIPCPKCKMPFLIDIKVASGSGELSSAEVEPNLWEDTRVWRCPWCAKDVQVLANEPDPSSCDECRANAPRPVSAIPAVSKKSTGLQGEPAASQQSRNEADLPKKNCPFCEGEVSEHAKKCRHCGEFLADSRKSNGPSKIKMAFWISLGCFGFLLFACCLLPNFSPDTSPAKSIPSVGDRVVVNTEFSICIDEDSHDEFHRLLAARDNLGLLQMEAQGRIFIVEAGTQAILLEGGIMTSRVRVTAGRHIGKAGLIASEFID